MRSSGVKEALLSFFSCSSYAWEIPVSCDIYCHAFWKQPKLEWTFFLMVDFCWGLVVCICSTWIEDFTEKCNEAGDVDLWTKYRTLENVQLIINFPLQTHVFIGILFCLSKSLLQCFEVDISKDTAMGTALFWVHSPTFSYIIRKWQIINESTSLQCTSPMMARI